MNCSNLELNHLIERLKHEKAELLNINEKNSKQIEHLNVEREELMQLNENLKRVSLYEYYNVSELIT